MRHAGRRTLSSASAASPAAAQKQFRVASFKLSKVRLLSKDEAESAPKGLPILTPALLASPHFRSKFFESSQAMALAKRKHLPSILQHIQGHDPHAKLLPNAKSSDTSSTSSSAVMATSDNSSMNLVALDVDECALLMSLSNSVSEDERKKDSWKNSCTPDFLAKEDELALQSGEIAAPRMMSPSEKLVFALSEGGEDVSLRTFLSECKLSSIASETLDLDFNHPAHGGTALHVAAGNGHDRIIVALVEHGANVNSRAKNGSTPLHWASGAGHIPSVQNLLNSGANPRLTTFTWNTSLCGKGSGQTAVHWAAESGHDEIIKLFAEFDPVTVITADERSESPRAVARKAMQAGSAQLLAELEEEEYVVLHLEEELSAQKILS